MKIAKVENVKDYWGRKAWRIYSPDGRWIEFLGQSTCSTGFSICIPAKTEGIHSNLYFSIERSIYVIFF